MNLFGTVATEGVLMVWFPGLHLAREEVGQAAAGGRRPGGNRTAVVTPACVGK